MFCALVALMFSGCLPPDPRPNYQDLWAVYGPTPDCMNRDRHVRYLTSLKEKPLRTGDIVTVEQYNQAIDMYVERLKWYCEQQ
jgi:hypothetical protein